MIDQFLIHNDFSGEFTDLNVYFLEMNYFANPTESNNFYKLFSYLVNRGYNEAANELWDNVIEQNSTTKLF